MMYVIKKFRKNLRIVLGLLTIALLIFSTILLAACGSGADAASDFAANPFVFDGNFAVADEAFESLRSNITLQGGSVALGGAAAGSMASMPPPPPAPTAPAPGQRLLSPNESIIHQPENASQPQAPRRIIRTGNVELTAEPEYFDDAMEALRDLAPSLGGFIDNSHLHTRETWFLREFVTSRIFNITLRVPVDTFDEAMHTIENLATVSTSGHSSEDVTAQFYDTQTRLETRRIEEERLLLLIEDATTITVLLQLEQRLSQTRTQIAVYEARLTNLATRAAYSTITVRLAEIAQMPEPPAPQTLGTRVSDAFSTSADGMLTVTQGTVVALARSVLPILTVLGLGYGAIKILKRRDPK